MKTQTLLLFCLSACIFLSCTKDFNNNSLDLKNKSEESIPRYKSIDEVLSIISHVESFDSLQQLIDYENSQNRISIGRLANIFYYNINPSSFADSTSLLNYCKENSEYLDIKDEENGLTILPKWKDISYRYVSNKNGLFIIDSMAVRLYDEFLVITSEENIDNLMNMDESCFLQGEHEGYYVNRYTSNSAKGIHDGCDRTGFLRYHTTSGNYQIILKIITSSLPILGPNPEMPDLCYFDVSVSVLNLHKVLGIWWEVQKYTTINGLVKIHEDLSNTPEWNILNKNATMARSKISSKSFSIYTSSILTILEESVDHVHIYGYNVTATAEGIGSVTLVGGNWN